MSMLLEIAGFQAAYARCIDDDRLEDWPGFFLDACLYRITTADNHRRGLPAGLVWADSRGMLADRVSALREANIYERQTYRHILGLPVIETLPDGAIRGETPFLVARIMRDGATDLFATGRYLDLWRRDAAGALKLAEKLVVCDSGRIDTLLAIPL
jgi:anthranilate 1,2-dioxygenase small subunit